MVSKDYLLALIINDILTEEQLDLVTSEGLTVRQLWSAICSQRLSEIMEDNKEVFIRLSDK